MPPPRPIRIAILSIAVTVTVTCIWLVQERRRPTTPSQDPARLPAVAGPSEEIATPGNTQDEAILRSRLPWATLRILDRESQVEVPTATIVFASAKGPEESGVELRRKGSAFELLSRPPENRSLWLSAAGYALENVTAALLRGGDQVVHLRSAMKYELTARDGNGVEAADVEMCMCRGVIGRDAEGGRLLDDAQLVWPTERKGGLITFWLAEGSFRPVLMDDSILAVAGEQLVRSPGSGSTSGELELAGVLVAAVRFLGDSPNTMRVRDVANGAKVLTHDKVQPLAERLARRLGNGQMFFVQTPRLADRHSACSGILEFVPGGGAPQPAPLDFQPIAEARVQEISSAPETRSGRLRVRILDREGFDVVGVRVPIHAAGASKSPAPVAFLHSGDEVALAAGSYILEPALPGAGERIAHPASVMAGQSCEAVIQLPNSLTKVNVSVQFDDESIPGYAVVTAVTSESTSVHRSRRPSDIPLWLPPGKARLEVVVSEDCKATLEIDVTRRDPSAPPIVVRVPKPR